MRNRRGWIILQVFISWIGFSGGALNACSENSPNFNLCVENALNSIIPTLKQDLPSGKGLRIDPIRLPSVNVSHTEDSMDVSLATWNVVITGLSDSRVHAVKTKNLYMGKLEIVLKVPEIGITGEYNSEGEMATFPLSSTGHFNITMKDVTMVCIVYLERYKIRKEGRLAVQSLSLDIVPGQIYIKPAEYLDGEHSLGKMLRVYLTENSYELYNMVKSPLMKYLSDMARIMINTYMTRVPDNHLIVA